MPKIKHLLLPLLIISNTYCSDLVLHAPNEGHRFSTNNTNTYPGIVLPGIAGMLMGAYIAGAEVINLVSVHFLHNLPTQPQTPVQKTGLIAAVANSLQHDTLTQKINPATLKTATQCTDAIKSVFLSLKPLCKEIDTLRAAYEKNAALCEKVWQKCIDAITKAQATNQGCILPQEMFERIADKLNLTHKEWHALALKQRYEEAQKVYTFGRAQVDSIANKLTDILNTQQHASNNMAHFSSQSKKAQSDFLKARYQDLQKLPSDASLKNEIENAICSLDNSWIFANSKAQKIIDAYTRRIITALERAQLSSVIASCEKILATHPDAQHTLRTHVSQKTITYLTSLGIDVDTHIGSIKDSAQQTLFNQNIALIDTAAQLANTNQQNETVQNYAGAAAHFSVTAIELLHENETEQATIFTDLSADLIQAGKTLVGIGKGAVEGVVDSINGTIQTIAHPINSTVGIAKGMGKLAHLVYNAYKDDPKTIAAIQKACHDFAQLPLDQQAEGISRFLVGIFAPSPLKFTKLASFNKGMQFVEKIGRCEAHVLRKTVGTWKAAAQFAWNVQRAELVTYNGISMLKSGMDAVIEAEQKLGRALTASEIMQTLDKLGHNYVTCAKVTGEIADQIKSELKILEAVKTAEDYLGKNVRTIINEYGDRVFLSEDGTRRIRFDINNTDPHSNPHGHIEFKIGDKWQKKPGPIYPIDVPHN